MKPFFKNLKNYLSSRKLPVAVTLVYTILVLVVLLHRFWQYEVFYYDHGYTESAAYQVAQFKMPLWDREGKSYAFVDHFYPSLVLMLAPFYWIWDQAVFRENHRYIFKKRN